MKVLNAINKDLLQRFAADRLNDLENKQVTALLQRFLRGELDESESHEMIDVLAENDRWLAFLDQVWLQQPGKPAVTVPPTLDGAAAIRMRNKLFDQVHRSNMTRTIFKLGTQFFFEVAVGLIRPFTHRPSKLQPRRKRKRQ